MERRSISAAACLLLAAAAVLAAPAGESVESETEPRTLVLALDGVPYRIVERARENGAFDGWPETKPLVSTFPSMTNVSFTAILSPLGAEPVRGYEVRHYDPEQNRIHGGGLASDKKTFAWKEQFHVISKGNYEKARIYMTSKSKAQAEMSDVETLVLESPTELMLAHIAATDMVTHFRGDGALMPVVAKLAARIDQLRRDYRARYGRPLRVILLSDHGNTSGKVELVNGVADALREVGLRPAKTLEHEDDVVPATYGVTGYGALFADPSHAETVATAMIRIEGVALAAWRTGDTHITVISPDGRARVRWRTTPGGRLLAYEPIAGDPLRLRATVEAMSAAGLVDREGYVARDDWFERTAFDDYPDGLVRLAQSLNGTWVANPATVILSMQPGYALGVGSVRFGAWFRGGRLEGTHGGLDRDSSFGFFLDSDPTHQYGPAIRASEALAGLAEGPRREPLSHWSQKR